MNDLIPLEIATKVTVLMNNNPRPTHVYVDLEPVYKGEDISMYDR